MWPRSSEVTVGDPHFDSAGRRRRRPHRTGPVSKQRLRLCSRPGAPKSADRPTNIIPRQRATHTHTITHSRTQIHTHTHTHTAQTGARAHHYTRSTTCFVYFGLAFPATESSITTLVSFDICVCVDGHGGGHGPYRVIINYLI